MQALFFKRLPVGMEEDKAKQIAEKIQSENFIDVQVKYVPDLKDTCFVLKSGLVTKSRMSEALEEEIRDWEVFGK